MMARRIPASISLLLLLLLAVCLARRESSFLRKGGSLDEEAESEQDVGMNKRPARQRELEMLDVWHVCDGDNCPVEGLGPCDGDCDKDEDCKGGMICFERRDGGLAVPGCLGGENDPSDTDYCVRTATLSPSDAPSVSSAPTGPPVSYIRVIQGSSTFREANTSSVFGDLDLNASSPAMDNSNATFSPLFPGGDLSLGMCQGICKGDFECASGLTCFRRNLGGDVPNCEFNDFLLRQSPFLLDFCTFIPTPAPTLDPTIAPSGPPTKRPTPAPTEVPTPAPTFPTMEDFLARWIAYETEGDLARCEGNCHRDWECAGNLICWGRYVGMDAPGCYFDPSQPDGIKRSDWYNVCVDWDSVPYLEKDNRLPPEIMEYINARFVGLNTNGDLARCEGNCRGDFDCAGDLVCWGRYSNMDAPGCIFDPSMADGIAKFEDHNICVDRHFYPKTEKPLDPQQMPPQPAMADWVVNETEGVDMARCTGDCSRDFDCEGELMCWFRVGGMDAPGCYFDRGLGGIGREDDNNICIHPLNAPDVHRLRMWWQEGYRWQEEREEQFWCMQVAGESIDVQWCDPHEPRQVWEFIYLPQGQALIKSVTEQMCLRGGAPNLRECNPNDPPQMWTPMNGGWEELHFELTREGKETDCLSNHHHPRAGEPINMRGCDRERNYTTSAWMFWW